MFFSENGSGSRFVGMDFRRLIAGFAILGVVASYLLGSYFAGEEGRGEETKGKRERKIGHQEGEGSVNTGGKKRRRGSSPGGRVINLESLSNTHDSNERLAILLELLEQSPTEGYGGIYLAAKSWSEHERRLVLHKMFQRNSLASLQFVKDHDPENLEFALDIGLKVDPEIVAHWAEASKVQTMDLVNYEDSVIPDKKIDEWIAASREARAGQEVPDWTKDLPSGKPVLETVKEVVAMSEEYSGRGRYWLVHSRDTRARMRAAGDIGWESDDMGWDEFDQWLLDLPVELAEAALAGRLERLAAENPGNAQVLQEMLDRYSEVYHLDQSFYLMAMRLMNGENGDQALIGQLIARIEAADLRENVTSAGVDLFGQVFTQDVYYSSSLSSAVAIEVGEILLPESVGLTNSAAAAEWASSIDDSRMRERAINSVAQSWARQDPEAAAAWVASLSKDPATSNSGDRISLNLESSQSESRGAPGGNREWGR